MLYKAASWCSTSHNESSRLLPESLPCVSVALKSHLKVERKARVRKKAEMGPGHQVLVLALTLAMLSVKSLHVSGLWFSHRAVCNQCLLGPHLVDMP